MRWVIDRLEGEVAIIDAGGAWLEIPRGALPEGAGEGWVLQITRDEAAESQARGALEARLAALMSEDDGGDLEL
ncbi:DUF3006 domain-containing protein [Myxococcota bacterium]|nr:DUF3006 domain-containing protein [Myxococcota bacterium]MBU1430069.1 DUF3006 domain-containing protein [Myxococcota bacterium]MBU1896290.1 DUF3006 domain-containing protein [Myxococcota bacterium]